MNIETLQERIKKEGLKIIKIDIPDSFGIINFDCFEAAKKFADENGGSLSKFMLDHKSDVWECGIKNPERAYFFVDFFYNPEANRKVEKELLDLFGYNYKIKDDDADDEDASFYVALGQAILSSREKENPKMHLHISEWNKSFAVGVIFN